jgi:hypothetical protein
MTGIRKGNSNQSFWNQWLFINALKGYVFA